MKCPNCGHQIEYGNACPKCRMDVVLFAGTIKLSDTLYNKGLARIHVSDYSGAIDCLNKSVACNKNNYRAHNLLGLVLFEIGRVGEALMHWVISNSLVKEDNPAARYIETVQKSSRQLEQVNDATRMYNQALGYLKQKSDDIAIIQLKKALELNPRFIDAMNLLTLCYMVQRDRDRALAMAERVLALDTNNTIALNYYGELRGKARPELRPRKQADSVKTAEAPAATGGGYASMSLREKRSVNFHIAEIITFVIGALCVFGVFYVLVLPAMEREQEKQRSDAQAVLTQVENKSAEQLADKQTVIDGLNDQVRSLDADIAQLNERNDLQERTNRVLLAYNMLLETRYQDAVDAMVDLDLTGLASDILEYADAIREQAYPKLVQTYYNQGINAYNARDYELAVVNLERAHTYTDDETPQRPDIYYFLGLTYDQLEDEEQVRHYMQALVNDYPNYNSKRITDAKRILARLG